MSPGRDEVRPAVSMGPMSSETLTVYGYKKCDTCRKAMKWLEKRGRAFEFVDITEDPPSAEMLGQVIDGGGYELKQLFNTSGQSYRQGGFKEKLPDLSRDEALSALAADGRLIKRPIVTDGRRFTVGFREGEFAGAWG